MNPVSTYALDSNLRVEQVLGKNAFETTQLVYVDGGEQHGPFVRKLINKELGLGSAYAQLEKAQNAGFTSNYLPRIYALAESDSTIAAVVEYIEGQTLAEAVSACSSYEERLALTRRTFPLLCRAVTELHTAFEAPIIHRDLKPSNIMLSEQGVKLLDLGIARAYKQGAEQDTRHFGTRPYAPPEQYGFGQTDVRSDVYALGKVLYFCLTGEEPDTDVTQGLETHSEICSALQNTVKHATKLDPDARPASATALLHEFEKATNAAGIPLQNRPLKVLGVVWDIALLLSACLVVMGITLAFLEPSPENQLMPTWYLFYSLFFWMLPSLLIALFLISDRRPLHRFIPPTRAPIKKQTMWGLVAIAILCLAWLAATFIYAM